MSTMFIALVLAAAPPSPTAHLRPGLEPLGFLVGHCWTAALPGGGSDRHCFAAMFDGQHVRDTHEVRGGGAVVYRGETIYSFDGRGIVFTYWNSLGGVSRGHLTPAAGRFDFDQLYRGPDGREAPVPTRWRLLGATEYETETSENGGKAAPVRFRRDD